MKSNVQPAFKTEPSTKYSGEILTPLASMAGTEGKTGRITETQSAFGHSFHIFSGKGQLLCRITNSEITVNSDVTASIGEMTQNDLSKAYWLTGSPRYFNGISRNRRSEFLN